MPKYNIAIEVEVLASDTDQAFRLVAAPFHDGTMEKEQPLWLNPLVGEPELMEE